MSWLPQMNKQNVPPNNPGDQNGNIGRRSTSPDLGVSIAKGPDCRGLNRGKRGEAGCPRAGTLDAE
jgi:hypothetical protein